MNFKKTLSILALVALLIAVPASFAQVTTTQTTLSAAITASATSFNVASATGIIAPSFAVANQPTGNQSIVVIDAEAIFVTAVNGTFISGIRGYAETVAAPHNANAIVWVGPPSYFNNTAFDPRGACSSTSLINSPQVNTRTGNASSCVASLWGLSDGMYFMPAPGNCFEAASANAGSGDGTTILDGSVPAVKGILSASGAGSLVFTCLIQIPQARINPSKGLIIKDITYLYGPQTLAPTSMTASTLKHFQPPAPSTSETAASATLVDDCNTCVQVPAVGSANFTALAAGRYYSEQVIPATPIVVSNDLRTFVFTFALAQSAASAMTVTSPGLWIHYAIAQ